MRSGVRRGLVVGVAAIVVAGVAVGLALSAGPPRRGPSQNAPSTTAGGAPPTFTTVPTQGPHVMVIVMENHSYSSIVGSPTAPYLNALIRRGGLATASYATTHPSLPNYLTLVSGSTQGITTDCTGTCSARGPQVVDQLQARGVAWRAYMQGAPSACYTGSGAFPYDRHHDPFVYEPRLVDDRATCDDVVPLSELAPALAAGTAPPFVWISPDVEHDMHTGTVRQGDTFLAQLLPEVLASGWYRDDGVVIVTFDEGAGTTDAGCCTGAAGGHVATIVVSARTRPGSRLSTPVDGAGILRTIETLYHLPYLGAAANAKSGTLLPLLGLPRTRG